MTETYKPGTVATATVKGRPGELVFRNGGGWWSLANRGPDAETLAYDEDVTDVRPLVVLDPHAANPDTDPSLVIEHLVQVLRSDGRYLSSDPLADQIEAQTRPPKPDEPTGLGAAIEGVCECNPERQKFVRTQNVDPDDPWNAPCGLHVYADINAVNVLSEGVQA